MLRCLQTPACHPKHSQPYPHCTPRRFACPGRCFHLVKEKRKKRTSAFSRCFLTLRVKPGCSGTVLAPGPQRRQRGGSMHDATKIQGSFLLHFSTERQKNANKPTLKCDHQILSWLTTRRHKAPYIFAHRPRFRGAECSQRPPSQL